MAIRVVSKNGSITEPQPHILFSPVPFPAFTVESPIRYNVGFSIEKEKKAAIDGKPVLGAVPANIHYWDTEELAAYLCGLDYNAESVESNDIENAL